MRSLVYLGPHRMELQEAAVPRARPGEVVIKVGASGVCGSDLHGYLGKSRKRVPPLVMGHEIAGTVESVGEAVRDIDPGTAVTVYPFITCGQCAACRRGDTSLCAARQVIGIDRPGGYADFVTAPRASVVPVPPGMPVVTASFAEPLANAVHIFNRSADGLVRRIAIFGAGTQGVMALQLARMLAPAVLVSVDIVPARLALARRLGATAAIDARTEDTVGRIRTLTDGEGVDLAIEAAGSSATRQAAVASARSGGRVVLLGLGEEITPLPAVDIVNREIAIRGSYAYTYDDFIRAVELLGAGLVSVEWARGYPLDAGPAVFRQLVTDPGDLIKAVLTPAAG
ncbi:MAG TPA: alcohol dehydrogenase catalytic domain-containing protein [bacterium]|nr:alcohol dehydrogenase catalytic domain-containing protein [bacterium]